MNDNPSDDLMKYDGFCSRCNGDLRRCDGGCKVSPIGGYVYVVGRFKGVAHRRWWADEAPFIFEVFEDDVFRLNSLDLGLLPFLTFEAAEKALVRCIDRMVEV